MLLTLLLLGLLARGLTLWVLNMVLLAVREVAGWLCTWIHIWRVPCSCRARVVVLRGDGLNVVRYGTCSAQNRDIPAAYPYRTGILDVHSLLAPSSTILVAAAAAGHPERPLLANLGVFVDAAGRCAGSRSNRVDGRPRGSAGPVEAAAGSPDFVRLTQGSLPP